MTAVVGSVAIDLQAQLARFESDMGRAARIVERELQKANAIADRNARQMQKSFESAASGINTVLTGLFAGVTVGAITEFAKHLVDVGDEINDLSQKFGLSTEALSVWRLVAEKSGTSLDGIATGAKILSKDLGDTEVKLRSMGLSLRDATGQVKPMETVMEEVAKKVANYRDGAEKAALMTALFGKTGVELIPFMNDLGKGLDEAKAKAEAFGVKLGPEFTRASDQFNDNLRDAKAVAEGFGNAVLSKILPPLNDMIGGELDAAQKHRGLQSAGEALGTHLAFLAGLFADVAKNVRSVTGAVDDLISKAPGLSNLKLSGINNAVVGAAVNPAGAAQGLITWAAGLAGVKLQTEGLTNAQLAAMIGTKDWTGALKGFGDVLKANAPHIKTQAELDKEAADREKAAAKAERERAAEEAHLLVIMKEGLAAHQALTKVLDDYAKAQDDVRAAIAKRHEEEDRGLRLAGMDEEARKRAENAVAAVAAATKDYNAAIAAGLPFTEQMLADEIAITEAKLNDTDATQKLTDANKKAADEIKHDWENAAQSMERALGDFFTGANNGLKGLVDSFARAGQQLVSGAFQRFISGGSSANVYGLQGTTPGQRAMGFVGGAAQAWQGYQSGNILQGVSGGAQAGAQYGGTTGAIVGAIIGGILAAFHGKPKPPEIQVAGSGGSIDRVENQTTTAFGVVRANTVGSGQLPSADVTNAIAQFDKQIASFMTPAQISTVTTALANFSVDLKKGGASIANVLEQRWQAILATFPQDIQDVVKGAGDLEAQVAKLADLLQFPAQLKAMMDQLGEADMLAGMSQFDQQVYQLNKQFDAAETQARAWGATEEDIAKIEVYRANALQRLKDSQNDATQAEEDATRAAQAMAEALKDVRTQINDAIWDDYLAGLSDSDRQIAIIHKRFQDMYDAAVRAGASERELTEIRNLERRATDRVTDSVQELTAALDPRGSIYQILDPIADAAEQLTSALQRIAQYLLSLRTNEQLSTLTPQQRLSEAQAQFNAMLAQARSGNVDAINSLPQYAQTLLEQARQFWASGPNYDAIFQSVTLALQSITKQFGSGSTDPFVRMANALELHLPSIDAALQQIAASPAAMPSYDSGTDFVPYDQVAKIHRGEAVLTASENAARKRGASSQNAGVSREVAALLRELIQEVKASGKVGSDQRVRIAAGIEKVGAAKSRNG